LARPIVWHVRPTTAEPADRGAARLGRKLLQWQWFNGSRPAGVRVVEALWMMFCTGLVVAKTRWDPWLGDTDRFGPRVERNQGEKEETFARRLQAALKAFAKRMKKRGLEALDEEAIARDEGLALPSGQPVLEFRTGFDITEPPYCHDVDDAAWLIDSQWVTLEQLRADFGTVATADVQAGSDAPGYWSGWRSLYAPADRGTQSDGDVTSEIPGEMILKHEFWRPHTPWAPQGCLVVVAGQTVLRHGPHPYRHGRYPFARL
ncbi:unnamed protein product, partial [marine sediment metagenome]